MAQNSRPMPDHVNTFPDSDAGPYSGAQWQERCFLENTGDPNTSLQRTQLRGVIPTVWDKLVVTNPAGVTIRVASGAGWCHGSEFIHDPNVAPAAPTDFTPSTPAANRIDRIVIVQNNTNAAYNTNLEFPTTLTDYAGLSSVPAYSTRLAILTGVVGGAARALVQSASYWMIELAQYTISAVPAISGLTDQRQFAQIEYIVGVHSDDDDTIKNALRIGTEVDDNSTGATDLGVGIQARLQDAGGTIQNAGRVAFRWQTPTAGAEISKIELRTEYITNEILSGVVVAPNSAGAGGDGNARGDGAVDLQGLRSAATMIATGDYSVVCGGEDNRAGASSAETHAIACGGESNYSAGQYTTICGGQNNTCGIAGITTHGFVGGGEDNSVAGAHAAISGGDTNSASAQYSTVGGGNNNTASGTSAICGGGLSNTSSGDYSTVGGGNNNTAGGAAEATVGGGADNTASGGKSTIGGGDTNTASQNWTTIAGGDTNTASGSHCTIGGGDTNTASANWATIPGGKDALADKEGQIASASGDFANQGDAQGTIQMVCRDSTTHGDAGWRQLYPDGTGINIITIAASTAWTFQIRIVGITQNAAKQWGYLINGVIERDNANNTTLAASNVNTLFESDANFNARVVADNVNEALQIEVQDAGASGDTVRWVATLAMAEVTFP